MRLCVCDHLPATSVTLVEFFISVKYERDLWTREPAAILCAKDLLLDAQVGDKTGQLQAREATFVTLTFFNAVSLQFSCICEMATRKSRTQGLLVQLMPFWICNDFCVSKNKLALLLQVGKQFLSHWFPKNSMPQRCSKMHLNVSVLAFRMHETCRVQLRGIQKIFSSY